ncbi:MAG: hypothetical protein AAGN66_30320 [Acidobacteriota bacterium]
MRPSRVVSTLILCEHQGPSVRDPFEPVAPWTGQVDLDVVRVVQSADGSIDLPFPRYLVRRILKPEWMTVDSFLTEWRSWSALWSTAASPTWPEAWQRYLVARSSASRTSVRFELGHLTTPRRLALIELLAPRRPLGRFHRSLREAAEAWLATWWRFEKGLDSEAPRFVSPLSNPQWQRLVRPHHHHTAPGLLLGAEPIGQLGVEISDDDAQKRLLEEVA